MPYRGLITVRKDGEISYSYYECVGEHHNCPTCDSFVGYFWGELRVKRCYPEKRMVISGWLWWKKKCPLNGVHDHYQCQECNTIWVCFHTVHIPSRKVHVCSVEGTTHG